MRIAVTGGSGFIGTNVIAEAVERGHEVINLDIAPPRCGEQQQYWRQVDLLNGPLLTNTLTSFAPEAILHLAARTDLVESDALRHYAVNTDGVANLLESAARLRHLRRVIFASTMLVCRYGYTPASEHEYCPNTAYGESKVAGERLVRTAALPYVWTIVRPTSIWGPWCEEPYKRFLTSVCRGMYVHVGSRAVPKALGFVGNTVFQLFRLLDCPEATANARTFYLLDYPGTTIKDWANSVQAIAGARRIPTVPLWSLRCAAYAGDLLKYSGWKNPPMTSFRLANMTTPSRFDTLALERLAGPLPYSLDEGVRLTLAWLAATLGIPVSSSPRAARAVEHRIGS